MALDKLTKIDGGGISTTFNYDFGAADVGDSIQLGNSGVITATAFIGDGSGLIGVASTDNIVTGTAATFNTYPVDINAGMIVAGVATFAGDVSIGGTLTYEDVKNVDSIGLGTFRNGAVVQTGTATTALIVEGNSRVTGILSVGTGTVVIDETTVKTGTSNLHSVGIEIAGVNVLGGDTPIGAGSTIYNSGAAVFTGIVTANKFHGDISEATGGVSQVFLGFKRTSAGNLLLDYSTVGDSSTYKTEDYEHRGGAQWLMADNSHLHTSASLAAIGSTTRPNGTSPAVGQPKYRFNPTGHLIINI